MRWVRRISLTCSGKKLLVTLGQFSIIRLERDTQLLIPAYDYACRTKRVRARVRTILCSMFSRIHFPIDEFFPPDCITPDRRTTAVCCKAAGGRKNPIGLRRWDFKVCSKSNTF